MSMLSTLKMYFRRTPKLSEHTDLYAHQVRLLDGTDFDLADLRGHPTLIVNTASKCGFTPQYAGLEALYEQYGAQGLKMLGFPSGDFAGQEFEEAGQIGEFCQRNYGVSFPLTERTSVRADPDSLWVELARQPDSAPPPWNFTKYLVGADGRLIGRWSPRVAPDSKEITHAIEAALAPSGSA